MITTLMRISRITLRRDRVAQAMTFVLPIAFFSIFASVFGGASLSRMPRVRVAVADEDRSDMSRYLIEALKADSSLRVRDSVAGSGTGAAGPIDRARAEAMVRGGDLPVAVVLPKGWGATFPNLNGKGMRAEMLADPSDPVGARVVTGLLQRAAARVLRGGVAAEGSSAAGASGDEAGMLVATHVTNVVGDRRDSRRMISFYAAGIAVMFLLFSSSSGGGALLDEQESGTLERVLNTSVGMTGLLAGKWVHLTLLGMLQVLVMFLWGAAVFGLDLLGHLPGFAIMTLATAAAAAAFGLVLATASRSRQQLSGLSTIVILVMSALGGSMFPRFLMSESMQRMGLVTFNAWALDGYLKVFWREAPLLELWPQLTVLITLTVVFLAAARVLARRWEVV
jgi:ABC-2 type transport system permease protein